MTRTTLVAAGLIALAAAISPESALAQFYKARPST
jgi:hypothetical protein